MSRRRGQIIPKGPDKWLVRYHVGHRRYASVSVSGSRREAEQVLTMKLREIDTHTAVLPQKLTVDQFLDRWLATKEPTVVPKTFQSYRDLLRLHVRPWLGHLRLDKVTPMYLQDGIGRLAKTLSPRMVQYVATVTSQAFKAAVQWRLLPVSPAVYLQLPRRPRADRRILSPAEARTLLTGTQDDPFHALWVILLSTGLRPSEALALQWADISPDGKLTVTRALRQVAPGKYEVADMKTAGSRRTLSVPPQVLEALERHRLAQPNLSPWVFRNREGKPWDIGKVRKAWYRALERCGLPKMTLYVTRHSHLSHLVMATGSLKVAQQRGGHSSIRLTGDTYAHLLEETHQETAQVVGKVLFG